MVAVVGHLYRGWMLPARQGGRMTVSEAQPAAVETVVKDGECEVRDFVCTACGCTCDDLQLTVSGRRVTAVDPPCPLAEAFLLREPAVLDAPCLMEGRPARLEQAL